MNFTQVEPRSVQDILIDLSKRVPTGASSSEFVQEFDVCDQHGKWALNRQDASGAIRWNPPGCPVCRKQDQVRALIANAEIPQRFAHCAFDNYKVDNPSQAFALKTCREYAENFKEHYSKGRCLVLQGNPGTGKNHLSSAIMIHVIENGYSALRIKASQFLDEYWSKEFKERDPWLKGMANIDLLVIDEIGRSSNGKSANDAFFRLIDDRYEAMKPTIVISNLSFEGLKGVLGEAATDRLREGGGIGLKFNWDSYRAGD